VIRPAFTSPPHVRFGNNEAVAWVVHPPGGVAQLTAEVRGTRELAQWVVGPALRVMLDTYPEHRGLIIVLDLSLMQGRDPAARAVMLEKARELARCVGHTYLVPPLKTNAVYRTTLHAAVALLSTLGIHVEMVTSAAEVIERLKLQPVASPTPRAK
jgi:hypothetical protein